MQKQGKYKLENSPGTIFIMYYNPSLRFDRFPDSCLGKGIRGQGDVRRGTKGEGRGRVRREEERTGQEGRGGTVGLSTAAIM